MGIAFLPLARITPDIEYYSALSFLCHMEILHSSYQEWPDDEWKSRGFSHVMAHHDGLGIPKKTMHYSKHTSFSSYPTMVMAMVIAM